MKIETATILSYLDQKVQETEVLAKAHALKHVEEDDPNAKRLAVYHCGVRDGIRHVRAWVAKQASEEVSEEAIGEAAD